MILRNSKDEWIPNIENMRAMSKHIADMVCVMKELHESFGSVLDECGLDISEYDYEHEEFKRILEASAKFMPNTTDIREIHIK